MNAALGLVCVCSSVEFYWLFVRSIISSAPAYYFFFWQPSPFSLSPNVNYVTRNSGGRCKDWKITPCVLGTRAMRLVKSGRARLLRSASFLVREENGVGLAGSRAFMRMRLFLFWLLRFLRAVVEALKEVRIMRNKRTRERVSERRKHRATDGEGIQRKRYSERKKDFKVLGRICFNLEF